MFLIPWQVYAIVGGIAALALALFMWRADIKDAVYKEVYATQVEQELKNKQDEIDKRQKLYDDAMAANADLEKKRSDLATQNDSMSAEIVNLRSNPRTITITKDGKTITRIIPGKPLQDGAVSSVLANTLDEINANEGYVK